MAVLVVKGDGIAVDVWAGIGVMVSVGESVDASFIKFVELHPERATLNMNRIAQNILLCFALNSDSPGFKAVFQNPHDC